MTTATATIQTYNLLAQTGRHVRKATKVIFADGYVVKFIELMTKRAALAQAIEYRNRHETRVDDVLITTESLTRGDRFEDSTCPGCAEVVGVHIVGRRVTIIERTCDCQFDRVAVEAVVEDLEIQFAGDNPENYSDGRYLGRHYSQFTF